MTSAGRVRWSRASPGEDESSIDILRPSELLSRLLADGRDGAGAHLALVGAPPEDGIGFALVPFAALRLRPRRVTSIDTARRTVRSQRRGRFLLTSAAPATRQMAASGAALGAQAMLQRALRPRPPDVGPRRLRRRCPAPTVGVPEPVGGP